MSSRVKLAIGSVLAAGGGLGIILRLVMGKPAIQGHGDFILGLVHGIMTGIGVVLVLFHLGKTGD